MVVVYSFFLISCIYVVRLMGLTAIFGIIRTFIQVVMTPSRGQEFKPATLKLLDNLKKIICMSSVDG